MTLVQTLTRTCCAIAAPALFLSCYRSTVTTEAIRSPLAERRSPTAPDDPVVTTDWAVHGRVVQGTLKWQTCVSEKSWTTAERKIRHRDPNKLLGGGLSLAGAGLFGVGVLTRDTEPTTDCNGGGTCSKDNSLQTVMIISGLAMGITGSVILLGQSSQKTESSTPQEHHKKDTIPCIGPGDLAGLEVSLLLPDDRALPVEMKGAELARVQLPNDVDLTLGGEWPVIVSRVPNAARDFLSEGEVVGAVRR